MRTRVLLLTGLAVIVLLASTIFASPLFAQNQKIDFEDFAGPSRFDSLQPPVRVLSATIAGGEILRNSSFAPAGRATVYGTSSECSGCSPEISIQFNQKVSDVELSYQSPRALEISYTTEDDQGNLHEAILPESFGFTSGIVSLPYQDIREVRIASRATDFQFVITSITFAVT